MLWDDMPAFSNTLVASSPRVAWPARSRVRAGTACLAVAVAAVWVFSLGRSVFDPIAPDQALYQYMAERLMSGDRLYVEVWDQNGPGIVLVHWISTRLMGSSPVAFRVFDALWQLATTIALMALVLRHERRWNAAWLAAGLYVLSYYSLGYVQTGQREGFAVLPLLMMAHLLIRSQNGSSRLAPRLMRSTLAGGLGLFVFAIKPPLGLCFGLLWLYACLRCWRDRHKDRFAPADAAGLTTGFALASIAGAAWLIHLGSWDGFWGVLSRRDMPGYILGPALIRSVLPPLLAGAIAVTLGAWVLSRCSNLRSSSDGHWTAPWAKALAAYALLLTARNWPGWQQVLMLFAGLCIPAIGAMLVRPWKDRGEAWRLCLLMLCASCAALILQGQYFLYHLPPLLAFAAMLSAIQIDEAIRTWPTVDRAGRSWGGVWRGGGESVGACLGGPTMAFAPGGPKGRAGTTLAGHYTSVTRHKLSCPTYATTMKAAERIRELTGEADPIACLLHDPRIFYFARRPSVHKLIAMQDAYRHMFADYMQAIRMRRPKVIVARVPESLHRSSEITAVQAAVYDQTESFFGPPGKVVRDLYHVTQIIDDLCILQPR